MSTSWIGGEFGKGYITATEISLEIVMKSDLKRLSRERIVWINVKWLDDLEGRQKVGKVG